MRLTNFNFLNIIYGIVSVCIIFISIQFVIFYFTSNPLFYSSQYLFLPVNFLGISLFISGVIVGLLIFWLADVRIFFYKILNLFLFIFFLILIILFISEKSYINLFILYELFLLPSFYLVYYMSPNRRSIPVALYFLTWTQFGSLLVLVAIVYLYSNLKSMYLYYCPSINFGF